MVEAETKIKSELISSEDGSKGVKDCFLYMKKQEKFTFSSVFSSL